MSVKSVLSIRNLAVALASVLTSLADTVSVPAVVTVESAIAGTTLMHMRHAAMTNEQILFLKVFIYPPYQTLTSWRVILLCSKYPDLPLTVNKPAISLPSHVQNIAIY